MMLQKRTHSATTDNHAPNGNATSPPKQAVLIDIQFHSPPRVKKHRRPTLALLTTSLLCCLFLTTLTLFLHRQIVQFEHKTQKQHSRLRRTLNSLLFDPLALPPHSNLHGRYSGCLLLQGRLAPHNFTEAVFVDKDIEVVHKNGTGSKLIRRHRLRAYDYDEVKGLVAAFDNAFVYGQEPLVYDCHVKFRPGGANMLDVDGMGRALEQVTLRAVDGFLVERKSPAWGTGTSSMIYNNIMPGAMTGWRLPSGIPPPPLYYRQSSVSDEIEIINGTAILIAQFWGERYYHWMSECMPRLALVKDYLDAHPNAKLLFFPGSETNQLILKLLDIDPHRVIPYTPYKLTYVTHLLVPTATAEGRIIRRAGAMVNRHFRHVIPDLFHMPQPPPGSWRPLQGSTPNILIQQRAPGGARSMTNGNELIQTIQNAYPHALVEVFHHNETIWNAIRMHYGADLVIGPHGAGESNALFMRPGAILLEIYMKVGMMGPTEDWVNPCHNHTSNSVGVKHYYVRSKTGDHGSPMEVDIDVVMEKLLEIFPYNSTYNGMRHLDGWKVDTTSESASVVD